VGGATRPLFEPVGCCGGLVLLGLLVGSGGVASPRPSWCGFQVIRVVFCCLQVFSGLAVVWGGDLFCFSFGVLCPVWGLVGESPTPAYGVRSVLLYGGLVSHFLYILYYLALYLYIYICHRDFRVLSH